MVVLVQVAGFVVIVIFVIADAAVANAVNMATTTTAFNTFITRPPVEFKYFIGYCNAGANYLVYW
jgi:hypothetical protein